MNPGRNINNNARRNEHLKGNRVEILNKTFVQEGTPKKTKVWVEKTKETSKKKMKLVIVAEKSLINLTYHLAKLKYQNILKNSSDPWMIT